MTAKTILEKTDEPTRRKKRYMWLAAGATSLALIAAACSDDQPFSTSAEQGSTDVAEGSEAPDGNGNGEAAEGGVVDLLTPTQTYDEVRSGVRLKLAYDSSTNAFTGTVENTTSGPLARTRVEVHLSNGTELGPTTPIDLAAGEIAPINLAATASPFDTWSAHPETGSGESSEAGGEGSAANVGGTSTHLSSTGISRGLHGAQQLEPGESYAGKLNDLELAIAFDPARNSFLGRVKNEANEGLCNTSVAVVLDGNQNAPQSVLIPALDVGSRADFSVDAGGADFTSWEAQTETFTCTTVVSDVGEGGEGSGSEGAGGEGIGQESGSEGGGEGGAESGEETSPSTPVDQVASGNFNSLDYTVGYDTTTNAFRGRVENNTSQTVCSSRLEIHMASNGQVIELGPTIGVDLAPDESLDAVLLANPIVPNTYTLHPESSPCR